MLEEGKRLVCVECGGKSPHLSKSSLTEKPSSVLGLTMGSGRMTAAEVLGLLEAEPDSPGRENTLEYT